MSCHIAYLIALPEAGIENSCETKRIIFGRKRPRRPTRDDSDDRQLRRFSHILRGLEKGKHPHCNKQVLPDNIDHCR